MKKLALIRNDQETPCPFGLRISSDCKTAGHSVEQMEPLADGNQLILSQNLLLLQQNPEKKQCHYAKHLFPGRPKEVDCDYGDTAAGLPTPSLQGDSAEQDYKQMGSGPLVERDIDGTEFHNLYYGIQGYASRSIRRKNRLIIWHHTELCPPKRF